ncbi:hypothetical protein [Zemynaea arenosa]|uniref:hypothetical protein n=1 Tax=Zemynaea arenosa TaxID=2561931 RepID=UPI00142F7E3B|nr:hypothetical protein [Massilia arenosa]
MFQEPPVVASREELQQRVDAVVAAGPKGAFAVAGVALAIVMACWVLFYVFVFVARGGV